jgi:phosphate:Na+ symporter
MFIPQLAELVVAISPVSPDLTGKAQMAADVPRQIANAHTVFNLANTLLFIGFTGFFARLAEKLVPDRPVVEKIIIEPLYLGEDVVRIPSMALEQVRFEIGHMGKTINRMLSTLNAAGLERDKKRCDEVRKLDDQVDILHDAILEYMSEIRQEPLTDKQSHRFQALMSATVNLENLANIINYELVDIVKGFIDLEGKPSEISRLLMIDLGNKVSTAVDQAVQAVRENDEKAAENVILAKDDIRQIADEFLQRQAERIGIQEPGRLNLVRLEMELLDKLRSIYTLAKRVAKDFVPSEVASKA